MATLLLDLSDWYKIAKVSTELINPNTYATMKISQSVTFWIMSKGGYLAVWLAWNYPGTAMIMSIPLLIKQSSRKIITNTCYYAYQLTAYPVRYLTRK